MCVQVGLLAAANQTGAGNCECIIRASCSTEWGFDAAARSGTVCNVNIASRNGHYQKERRAQDMSRAFGSHETHAPEMLKRARNGADGRRTDGRTDGWMDGWMDGRAGGQREGGKEVWKEGRQED